LSRVSEAPRSKLRGIRAKASENRATRGISPPTRGTPISVRVKGHKKKVNLKPILDKIDKIWDQFLVKEISQVEREVDAYLKRLKRRTRQSLWP